MSSRLTYSRSERLPEYLIRGATDAIVPVVGGPDGVTPESEAKAKHAARRLVACWNACDGVSTEVLEDVNSSERELLHHYVAMQGRCDELLADIRLLITKRMGAEQIREALQRAIAKAGGTA